MKHGFRKRVTEDYWPARVAVAFGTRFTINPDMDAFFVIPNFDFDRQTIAAINQIAREVAFPPDPPLPAGGMLD